MKGLLVGLLAVGSISAFAQIDRFMGSCEVTTKKYNFSTFTTTEDKSSLPVLLSLNPNHNMVEMNGQAFEIELNNKTKLNLRTEAGFSDEKNNVFGSLTIRRPLSDINSAKLTFSISTYDGSNLSKEEESSCSLTKL